MKVTAILSDNLVEEIKKYSKGKNLTESLTIALEKWLNLKKIKKLNCMVKEKPLKFNKKLTAENIRESNRQWRWEQKLQIKKILVEKK